MLAAYSDDICVTYVDKICNFDCRTVVRCSKLPLRPIKLALGDSPAIRPDSLMRSFKQSCDACPQEFHAPDPVSGFLPQARAPRQADPDSRNQRV